MNCGPTDNCVQLLVWLHQIHQSQGHDSDSNAPQQGAVLGSPLFNGFKQALGTQLEGCDVKVNAYDVFAPTAVQQSDCQASTVEKVIAQAATDPALNLTDVDGRVDSHASAAMGISDECAEQCTASQAMPAGVHIVPSPACLAFGEDMEVEFDLVLPEDLRRQAWRLVLECNGTLLWDQTYAAGVAHARCRPLPLHTTGVTHAFFLSEAPTSGCTSLFAAFSIPVLPPDAAEELISLCSRAAQEVVPTTPPSGETSPLTFDRECFYELDTSPLLPSQVNLPGIQTKSQHNPTTAHSSCDATTTHGFCADIEQIEDQEAESTQLSFATQGTAAGTVHAAEIWRKSIAGISADMGVVLGVSLDQMPSDGCKQTAWLHQYWTTAETLFSFLLSQGMTNTCLEVLMAMEERGVLSMCAPLFTVDESTMRSTVQHEASSSGTSAQACHMSSAGMMEATHGCSLHHAHDTAAGVDEMSGVLPTQPHQLRRPGLLSAIDLYNANSVTSQLLCSVLLLVMSVVAGIFKQLDHSHHPSMLLLPLVSAACISTGPRVKKTVRLAKSTVWILVAGASILAPTSLEGHLNWMMPVLAHKGWVLLELIWVSLSKVTKETQLAASLSDMLCCTAMLWVQNNRVQHRDMLALVLTCIASYALPKFFLSPQSYDFTNTAEAAGWKVPEGFEHVECTILTVMDRVLCDSPRRSLPDSPSMLSTAKMIRCQLLVKDPILLDTPESAGKPSTPSAYKGFYQIEATMLLGLLSSPETQDLPEAQASKNKSPLSTATSSHRGQEAGSSSTGDCASSLQQATDSAGCSRAGTPTSSNGATKSYTWHLCRILTNAVCSFSGTHDNLDRSHVSRDTLRTAGQGDAISSRFSVGSQEREAFGWDDAGESLLDAQAAAGCNLEHDPALLESHLNPAQLREVRCHFWVKDVLFLDRQGNRKSQPTVCHLRPVNCGLLLKV